MNTVGVPPWHRRWQQRRRSLAIGRLSLGQGLENRLQVVLLLHELVRPSYRIEDVAAFLGHRNLTTAQGYAQVRADRVHELAQNLASPVPATPAETPRASRPKKRRAKRTG